MLIFTVSGTPSSHADTTDQDDSSMVDMQSDDEPFKAAKSRNLEHNLAPPSNRSEAAPC